MQQLRGKYTLCVIQRRIQLKICNIRLKSWNIVFFGSDDFSLGHLSELLNERKNGVIKNIEVVTASSENILYKFSSSKSIKVHLWPPDLKGNYDIGVVASFGKLIPEHLINLFPLGIINVHPSILPRWRGPMPIVHALKNGDAVTGITIQKIKPKIFDVGDQIMKRTCEIGENELLPALYKKLTKFGSECLVKVVRELPESLDNCVPLGNDNATYAKKLNKSISTVRWSELTGVEIFNLYRALFGLNDLRTSWKGETVKILCLSFNNSDENFGPPGSLKFLPKCNVLLVNSIDKPVRICTVLFRAKVYGAHNFFRGFVQQYNTKEWSFDDGIS
ncbi:hypothetical protein RUM43_010277 [Polyplax serrata]|uniref:methionyl-tRNA formyltransferase n=1 Tax=Polyplax serrata TaxID=468196 RepID=A0AAN8PL58_POLSC